ncbi:MAG TPA: hypothetical protein VGQ57_16030, partial [Polyangiaceae bacterium]|nr:hypothetical protein [Polyangiaceae bacterium]
MTTSRSASLLFFGGLLGLLVPSCFTVGDDDSASSCSRGAKGCECKSNDTCNTGLTCDAKGHCVEH